MSLTAGTRIGSFQVVEPIGSGGMGEVYRARDTRLGRDVALKVLPAAFASDQERLARFEREARMLATLNHPHIAQIHGLEDSPAVDGGLPLRALIMELRPPNRESPAEAGHYERLATSIGLRASGRLEQLDGISVRIQ